MGLPPLSHDFADLVSWPRPNSLVEERPQEDPAEGEPDHGQHDPASARGTRAGHTCFDPGRRRVGRWDKVAVSGGFRAHYPVPAGNNGVVVGGDVNHRSHTPTHFSWFCAREPRDASKEAKHLWSRPSTRSRAYRRPAGERPRENRATAPGHCVEVPLPRSMGRRRQIRDVDENPHHFGSATSSGAWRASPAQSRAGGT